MARLSRRTFLGLMGALSVRGALKGPTPKDGPYQSSFLHPNDHWVAVRGDHKGHDHDFLYEIVDLESGKVIQRLEQSEEDTYYGTPRVQFDPSGAFLVQVYWGTHYSSLRRWRVGQPLSMLEFKPERDDVPHPMELPPPGGFVRFPTADYDLAEFRLIRQRAGQTEHPAEGNGQLPRVVSMSGKVWTLTATRRENSRILITPKRPGQMNPVEITDLPMLWEPSESASSPRPDRVSFARRRTKDSVLIASGFCTVREYDASTGKVLRVVSGTMPQTGLIAFGASRSLLYAARPLDKPVLWDRNRTPKSLPEHFDSGSSWPQESLPYLKVGPGAPAYVKSQGDSRPPAVRALAASRHGLALGLDDGRVLLGGRHHPDGGPWQDLGTHGEAVRGLAFAPDQLLMLSGSRDGSLKVWDLDGAHLLRDLPPHEARVNAVAVAEGGLAASAGPDGIRIWDLHSGSLRRHLPTGGVWFSDIALDLKGAWIVGAMLDGSVRRWNLESGALDWHQEGEQGWCACLAYHAGTGMLAAGFELGTIRLLDPNSGNALKRIRVDGTSEWQGGWRPVHALAWSHDGEALAAAFGDLVRTYDRNLLSGAGHEWLLPLDAEDGYT